MEIMDGIPELAEPVKPEQPVERAATAEAPTNGNGSHGDRPGDDFTNRGSLEPFLEKHGAKFAEEKHGQRFFTRPGKDHGISASIKDGVFWCYTSNWPPFAEQEPYSLFQALALLEHNGDHSAAAAALAKQGYGKQTTTKYTCSTPNAGKGSDRQPADDDETTISATDAPAKPKPAPAPLPTSDIKPLRLSSLLKFDFKNDASLLIHGGWMTKGSVNGVIGQTGIGKSAYIFHLATHWAGGLSAFGLRPVRPLTCVLIQGENSERILAKEATGIVGNVPAVADHADEIDKNLYIYSESRFAGDNFHRFARTLILKHRPDVVLVDPFFSFLGGDSNSQMYVSGWMRNGLMSLAFEFGTAFVIAHHTPKPSRDPKAKSAYSGGDWSYFGAGSAEFANACRNILTLRAIDEQVFELRAPKAQEGPPLTASDEPNAARVNLCHLQHGDNGAIYWRRADADAVEALDENAEEVRDILAVMKETAPPDGRGWRFASVVDLVKKERGGTKGGAKTFFVRHIKPKLKCVAGMYAPL